VARVACTLPGFVRTNQYSSDVRRDKHTRTQRRAGSLETCGAGKRCRSPSSTAPHCIARTCRTESTGDKRRSYVSVAFLAPHGKTERNRRGDERRGLGIRASTVDNNGTMMSRRRNDTSIARQVGRMTGLEEISRSVFTDDGFFFFLIFSTPQPQYTCANRIVIRIFRRHDFYTQTLYTVFTSLFESKRTRLFGNATAR